MNEILWCDYLNQISWVVLSPGSTKYFAEFWLRPLVSVRSTTAFSIRVHWYLCQGLCMQSVCVREGLYHLHSTTANEYLDIQPFLVQAQALALEALKCNKWTYEQNVTLICLMNTNNFKRRYRLNRSVSNYQKNSYLAPWLSAIKQEKRIINPWSSMRFLLFYST